MTITTGFFIIAGVCIAVMIGVIIGLAISQSIHLPEKPFGND